MEASFNPTETFSAKWTVPPRKVINPTENKRYEILRVACIVCFELNQHMILDVQR